MYVSQVRCTSLHPLLNRACSALSSDCVPISGPMIGTSPKNTNKTQTALTACRLFVGCLVAQPTDGTIESNRIKMCKQISTLGGLLETMHNYREHFFSCSSNMLKQVWPLALFSHQTHFGAVKALFSRWLSTDANRIYKVLHITMELATPRRWLTLAPCSHCHYQ